jgi:hypothetical protein
MRGWLVIGAGAILLAAALAIEAPASLVDRRVADLTDGRIRIAAATGTVWNGSGELALLPDGARIPIAWRLEPIRLLRGGLAGSLTAGDATRPATFTVEREFHRARQPLPCRDLGAAHRVPDADECQRHAGARGRTLPAAIGASAPTSSGRTPLPRA